MRRKPQKNPILTQDTYKRIALDDFLGAIGAKEILPKEKPTEQKKGNPSPQKKPLPYRREGLSIVDIYQVESSDEDEGKNILRIELSNGTVRDFVVKNGSKGSEGYAGIGGMRGPRGATGPIGPAGPKGDPPSVGLRYDGDTGWVYYSVSDAEVLDEEAF